jgi:EAL domain-containing protein (putative c-di-GMP-specific phosphodiesterase class I)
LGGLSLKAPRNPHRLSCTLELSANRESEHDDTGEAVIRIATPSGQNLMSLSIAHEIVQHMDSARAQATPSINIDGSVTVMFDDDVQQTIQVVPVGLDQLVAEAISTEMLEDEPDALRMLSKFRDRLLKSLEHVEKAVASLPKD